ncbi:MAG: TIGR01777 family oxidoreductase [Bacteroidota bacterium]
MKKIVIAGGTGFIGSYLTNHFINQNYQVIVLTRNHRVNNGNIKYEKWDGSRLGKWQTSLENAEALINLNGKSVDCRYTEKNKQLIYDTRIEATNVLGKAITNCQNPPKVWINGASATIYPHSVDQPMKEDQQDFTPGFSVDVCQKWEEAFHSYEVAGVRKVLLRIAIILGENKGALAPLKSLARFGLGGKQGPGNQMFSWLHEKDMANVMQYCIENKEVSGIYNASAPNPVTNKVFMKTLRKQLKQPIGIPMPIPMLKLGALMIGTETELILKSRYVVPEKLLNAGFQFEYPQVDQALRHLCG